MTYYVTALTNDNAQLIAETLQTSDRSVAELVIVMWREAGYKLIVRQEG